MKLPWTPWLVKPPTASRLSYLALAGVRPWAFLLYCPDMSLGALWMVFSFSFVVALSGALAPGPLLTYTVVKTMQSRRRGYMVGAWVIAGHAALESVLIAALLLGFSAFLRHPLAARVIGAAGGAFLLFMGAYLLLRVLGGRVAGPFNQPGGAPAAAPAPVRGSDAELAASQPESPAGVAGAAVRLPHPVLGGALVSMSNPYWWIWWATIGLAFMNQYEITYGNWPLLLAFFSGHEAGDLGWFWAVSILVHLGRGRFTLRIYRAVLVACAAVMAGFGLYLGISPFLS